MAASMVRTSEASPFSASWSVVVKDFGEADWRVVDARGGDGALEDDVADALVAASGAVAAGDASAFRGLLDGRSRICKGSSCSNVFGDRPDETGEVVRRVLDFSSLKQGSFDVERDDDDAEAWWQATTDAAAKGRRATLRKKQDGWALVSLDGDAAPPDRGVATETVNTPQRAEVPSGGWMMDAISSSLGGFLPAWTDLVAVAQQAAALVALFGSLLAMLAVALWRMREPPSELLRLPPMRLASVGVIDGRVVLDGGMAGLAAFEASRAQVLIGRSDVRAEFVGAHAGRRVHLLHERLGAVEVFRAGASVAPMIPAACAVLSGGYLLWAGWMWLPSVGVLAGLASLVTTYLSRTVVVRVITSSPMGANYGVAGVDIPIVGLQAPSVGPILTAFEAVFSEIKPPSAGPR